MNTILIRAFIGAAGMGLVTAAGLNAGEPDLEEVRESALNVEDLVAEVVAGNPELAFYRAEIAAARGGRKAATQWENPELSVDVGQKRASLRSGAKLGDGVAWSISVAQRFEFPGRVALRKAIANGQLELAQLGLERAESALAGRARSLGYAVHAAQERALSVREVAERFNSLVEVLIQRDVGGVTPLLDRRILEASTITLNRRASLAEQEWQSALVTLNQLRGQPATAPLRLMGATFMPTCAPAVGVLLETARTNNFDVRMRQTELVQQGFEVELRKNERWPGVTLAPFYSEEEAADRERMVGLGVSLPLPLWNQNSGAVEVAQARLQQASALLQAAVIEVEAKVVEHALALETKVEEIRRWRGDAPKEFREAAELADQHYRLGAVPVTTYVEMQLGYLEALEALLATRGEALEHWQALELLVGRPLQTLE